MDLKIQIRGVEKLQEYLRSVPRGTVKVALQAFSEYFLGTDAHGLRHMEPYRYVSRKKAYGQTFKSDKQRRWFWANGGPDMIGNNRTGASASAWTSRETNGGYGVTFSNPSEGAHWIWSDQQAAQPRLVGHRTAMSKIASNMAGAMRHASAAVSAFLKKKG
jgi:hypothetical protein